MNKTRVGGVVVAAVALALTAACSSSGTTGDAATTGAAPSGAASTTAGCSPVTINYWHAYSSDGPEVKQLETVIIPAFEKANPCITVKDTAVPYDDLHQKLITAAAGGQLPDVVRSDIIWVPELANLGVLDSLDTDMPGFQDLASSTYDGALGTAKWGGHYYGLPLDTNTLVQLVNPAVLQQAGLQPATTMDQFKSNADALKAKGLLGYADSDLKGWNLLPFIWSFGGDIVSPDGTKASGYVNSPQTVQAVQFVYDLYKAGELSNYITQSGKTSDNDDFGTAKVGTIFGGPWMWPIFQSSYPDLKFQAAQIPSGKGGSVSVVGGEDVVVMADSPQKDADYAFVKYLLSDDAQLAMAKIGQMSVLKSLGDQEAQVNSYYAPFIQQLATAKPRPATPAWNDMDGAMEARLQQAFLGDGNIQAAMDDLATQFDGMLAKYQK